MLDDELLNWANEAEEPCKAAEWKEHLLQQGIGDLKTLKERAESSRWQHTLDTIPDDGLVAKLEHMFPLPRSTGSL